MIAVSEGDIRCATCEALILPYVKYRKMPDDVTHPFDTPLDKGKPICMKCYAKLITKNKDTNDVIIG